jgi:hypothetical protein
MEIHRAVREEHETVVRLLMEEADIKGENKLGNKLLH